MLIKVARKRKRKKKLTASRSVDHLVFGYFTSGESQVTHTNGNAFHCMLLDRTQL